MEIKKNLSLNIVGLCLIVFTCDNVSCADKGSLEMVQVVMRHGQRNPVRTYPLDPFKDVEKHWPEGLGRLTKTGLRQTFELGQFLRSRYDGFIDRTYKENDISVTCSDVTRTITSGLSTLRGLYPAADVEEEDNNNCRTNQFQIVPVRTVPVQLDNFLMMTSTCPRYKQEFSKYLFESEENQKFEKENKHWLDLINKGTGLNVTTLNGTVLAIDNISARVHQNKTLPEWVTLETVTFIKSYITYWLQMEVGTAELKRLRSQIAQNVISNMRKKQEGSLKTRMILYSGHDRTITAFLRVMNFSVFSRPPHASALLIELHKHPKFDDYHVEIFYRNTTEQEPFKLEIPNCESPCFLTRLRTMTQPLFFDDYEQECQIHDTPSSSSSPTSSSFLTQFLIIFTMTVHLF